MTATRKAAAAVAREDLPTLEELRPRQDTSAEIRAAYYRLVAAREQNQSELDRLIPQRASLILTGGTAEIARHDENIRNRKNFAEQLDVLEAELRRLFTVRKEAEEDAEFDERRAEIDAKVAAFNNAVLADYPAAAATIVALLDREQELLAEYAELSLMPARARKLRTVPLSVLTDEMQKAHGTDGLGPKTLGGAVILPGLSAGYSTWPKSVSRQVR